MKNNLAFLSVKGFILIVLAGFNGLQASELDNLRLMAIASEESRYCAPFREDGSVKGCLMYSKVSRTTLLNQKNKIKRLHNVLNDGANINYSEQGYYLSPPTFKSQSLNYLSTAVQSEFWRAMGQTVGLMYRVYLSLNYEPSEAKEHFNQAFHYIPPETDYSDRVISYQSSAETGFTALMYATYEAQDKVVDYLLRQKADVNILDKYGWNAYAYAENNAAYYKKMIAASKDSPQKNNRPDPDWDDFVRRYTDIACQLRPFTENTAIQGHSSNCNLSIE